jgi:hypothetical protein
MPCRKRIALTMFFARFQSSNIQNEEPKIRIVISIWIAF